MKIVGYICKELSIKDMFYWGDFNSLTLNGAYSPYKFKEGVCKYCEDKEKCSKPKKITINIQKGVK